MSRSYSPSDYTRDDPTGHDWEYGRGGNTPGYRDPIDNRSGWSGGRIVRRAVNRDDGDYDRRGYTGGSGWERDYDTGRDSRWGGDVDDDFDTGRGGRGFSGGDDRSRRQRYDFQNQPSMGGRGADYSYDFRDQPDRWSGSGE